MVQSWAVFGLGWVRNRIWNSGYGEEGREDGICEERGGGRTALPTKILVTAVFSQVRDINYIADG